MIYNNIKIEIRQEQACDYPMVYDVNLKAFKRKAEARLTDRLRLSDAFIPELSLVAIVDKTVVGHILFTKISIDDDGLQSESLSLAPMAVLPEMQSKGVGSRLVDYGLDRARSLGYKSVIVIGHAKYYSRFGFEPTSKWQIKAPFHVPANAFMAIELVENSLSGIKGIVKYAKEFIEI
ncbi:N-acetyltransferase [Dysgonomonas sp. Marseille-P4677]|uniref:GNAT family N-acetyltransferase n=1 Tax=Dysgonomonas sp. Marseille-P4677 TaxID=2364790 RepID=UPI001914844D|nr:N-acetyltransferase [Dysgonomonas sp. Marseille-P4677]MBK5721924.1 N-acetyltransferase [Dysgonomonas sp. Marseille-P4677]